MKKEAPLKLKKGGLDTIVAYIVVMLPLFYVLVYMIATIYHFSVQQYVSQVVKEACVMASTYGGITTQHEAYIYGKLEKVARSRDTVREDFNISYYVRKFNPDSGVVANELKQVTGFNKDGILSGVEKGDIIGIYVKSTKKNPSLLGTVGSFNVFMFKTKDNLLRYSAYREEIIRNERNQ